MTSNSNGEPLPDLFTFEILQLIDALENNLIDSEKQVDLIFSINEIFRITHTLKGSASMMRLNNIANLAHSLEDLFYYLKEKKLNNVDYSKIVDLSFESLDLIKSAIKSNDSKDIEESLSLIIINNIKDLLNEIKQNTVSNTNVSKATEKINKELFNIESDEIKNEKKYLYEACITFEYDCMMENIRSMSLIYELKEIADIISYNPQDLEYNNDSIKIIQENGLNIRFRSDLEFNNIREHLQKTVLVKNIDLVPVNEEIISNQDEKCNQDHYKTENNPNKTTHDLMTDDSKNKTSSLYKNIISVSVIKLDKLLDLVGELVTAQAMVTQNQDLIGLSLKSFYRSAAHLNKIINELQDTVMEIRMLPISTIFLKMYRIVRDMSKKLNKDISLEIYGEDTEVDKNIIEHLADPLIHLIRNCIDHGIETKEERIAQGKDPVGKIILEAKNEGGDVFVIVKDDGRGLDKDKILEVAKKNRLITKNEDKLSDQDIFSCIFLPCFSTKETITEFSGRGIGMNVVLTEIQAISGSVQIYSKRGEGTSFNMKIPLTLAIIEGMMVNIGNSKYIIPIINIRETLRLTDQIIISDQFGNEIVIIRGKSIPVVRLHKIYNKSDAESDLNKGILIIIDYEYKCFAIFVDKLIGEQQVVVKSLPKYIKRINGISGCTILGDGSISLILDVGYFS